MKYVHPDYKTKEVIQYIDDLIVNGNVKSVSDLTLLNRIELSGMLLKTEQLTEILNFISQNDNDEKFRDSLVECMCSKTFPPDKAMSFLGKVISFSEDYYEPTIESILNERLDHYATY